MHRQVHVVAVERAIRGRRNHQRSAGRGERSGDRRCRLRRDLILEVATRIRAGQLRGNPPANQRCRRRRAGCRCRGGVWFVVGVTGLLTCVVRSNAQPVAATEAATQSASVRTLRSILQTCRSMTGFGRSTDVKSISYGSRKGPDLMRSRSLAKETVRGVQTAYRRERLRAIV